MYISVLFYVEGVMALGWDCCERAALTLSCDLLFSAIQRCKPRSATDIWR